MKICQNLTAKNWTKSFANVWIETIRKRIINDRIEKNIKVRQIGHTGERGDGFALHFYHGSIVGWTGIALC